MASSTGSDHGSVVGLAPPHQATIGPEHTAIAFSIPPQQSPELVAAIRPSQPGFTRMQAPAGGDGKAGGGPTVAAPAPGAVVPPEYSGYATATVHTNYPPGPYQQPPPGAYYQQPPGAPQQPPPGYYQQAGPPGATGYYAYPPPAAGQYTQPPPPAHAGAGHMGRQGSFNTTLDVEAQVMAAFADKAVRQGFIRKVFSIVAVQLAITVGMAMMCIYVTPIKDYLRSYAWPFYLSIGLTLGIIVTLSCNERLRRKHPVNMIFLGLFTLAQAFLVGMVTAFYDIREVALAFICTCAAVAVLALIAHSKIDVTSWGSYLMAGSVIVLILIIVGIFWINTIFKLVLCGIAAILFCVYIVYDIQLIMGGKQHAISTDEYVFAALALYLDIVNLFMWLLYLIGIANRA